MRKGKMHVEDDKILNIDDMKNDYIAKNNEIDLSTEKRNIESRNYHIDELIEKQKKKKNILRMNTCLGEKMLLLDWKKEEKN